MSDIYFSTGLKGLDDVLQGVMPGDNIVFQAESIDDYIPFVHSFCAFAETAGRDLIYFRFADHEQLLPESNRAHVYHLHPEDGFETFLIGIHRVIEHFGVGACYVFDCLSELAVDWYSDRMLGNFFMLTCPYLYDFKTATYFSVLRGHHSPIATNAIHNTAQVVLDVYSKREKLYLHPLKVWKRHTPHMYTLHSWEGDQFKPVTHSSVISEILSGIPQPWIDSTIDRPDLWTRTFRRAREVSEDIRQQRHDPAETEELLRHLLRMVVSRDKRFLQLAERYLDIETLLDIGRRMIGTGLIGGKSAGMILARAILKNDDPGWEDILEAHDSFYIGSDVFYTYLVLNGCWHVCRLSRDQDAMLDSADEARRRLLTGTFPDDIKGQFVSMLDYFGQSPIIVRSSSLLEDAYGNAFSGKYESVFCTNQGTPQERLEMFIDAVRRVYASTMNKEALAYRIQRGLFDRDEQMALLIQRVSGEVCGDFYYPQMAGVGFSFNPFVWSKEIDPYEGMIRLVFGLGTRAVDRSDDDYTRIVALNAPEKRPESSFHEVKRYTQRKVDVLDLKQNSLCSRYFDDIAPTADKLQLELFTEFDDESAEFARRRNRKDLFPWYLTFDKVLERTDFVTDMRRMLRRIQQAYEYPVDIEFTTNFFENGAYRINLVQCRPFQARGDAPSIGTPPADIKKENLILRTNGPIIGTSLSSQIDRLVYVIPKRYSVLRESDRYAVARLIGRITRITPKSEDKRIMLIGPGRWGTSTPSLGVPVAFADINNVSIICEAALMHEGLVPDVSLGTHFFNDLVEMDILYCAVHPERDGNVFQDNIITGLPNALPGLIPDAAEWASVVYVLESESLKGRSLRIHMNSMTQTGVCFIEQNMS